VPKIHYVCRSAMHMAGISKNRCGRCGKGGRGGKGGVAGVVCSSISNTKLPFWLGARPQQKFPFWLTTAWQAGRQPKQLAVHLEKTRKLKSTSKS